MGKLAGITSAGIADVLNGPEPFFGFIVPLETMGIQALPPKHERVELEMKIMKYRLLARNAPDELTVGRIKSLVAELERKVREIDE
jgi:hypothetical protein